MRTKHLLPVVALVLAAANLSANGDSSQQRETPPSVVVGVVHDVTVDGDNVIVHLYREPYDVITVKWQRVHAFDGREMYAGDLIEQDNVRIEGDLDPHNRFLTVRRIKLTSRIEHRGAQYRAPAGWEPSLLCSSPR